jgi:hypothetical protein
MGGIRESSGKKHGAGLVGTSTRCRPLRGSGFLLLRSFPRLARRGPHYVATIVAEAVPSASILVSMRLGGRGVLVKGRVDCGFALTFTLRLSYFIIHPS